MCIRDSFLSVAAAVFLGVLGYSMYRVARPESRGELGATLSVAEVMGEGGEAGFARAREPRPFRFPEDHGPHPEHRTEWWYITGNLEGPGNEPYGFQFTLFRSTLDPKPRESVSAWATNQVYMGHLALTDGASRTFRAFERFSRGGLGLAGAQARPFRVWLEDWVLEETGFSADAIFPIRLEAGEGETKLSLLLTPAKPMVLQGEDGLSQKGSEPGNASYYYSYTRLETEGTVSVQGKEVPVRGLAWMDREWSTSALSQGQVGWDWFALQLSDGTDLMYYQLRLEDGTADPLSKGVLVDEAGGSRLLSSEMVDLTVQNRWRSSLDGTEYPSGWRLEIPDEGIDLQVTPLIPDQELELTFRYWEGSVTVRGTVDGRPVDGRGYVELTGYSDVDGESRTSMGRATG